ncbi:MAG: Signal recognition particle protein [Deltaproteobacteria bacterium ADurb.BinA179]|jgi:signal recognition particle subunit SRP54|nr:signal recognition particle protein [Deltaproteobacteria bacterium]MDI9542129.1 signal recognition particle protein [Pseudomonadota bacterium]OPZ29933.1 MAG: Signal recognition particle protein [Deltaproteobacteria bacterium ADurb.BinA179]HOD71766.1 signal recognition particle protein [Deltaproteobacteria bacterium]HOE73098.1 signal recognition particle protein [Deltaproteobacteria bacterium]
MLEMISGGFRKAQNLLQGKVVLQEKHIDEAVKEIRLSLLEADVEFHVVKSFIDKVREKALGEIVQTRVSHGGKKLKATPEQHFIKICYDELVKLMGPVDTSLALGSRTVSAVMMVGLQGSGKTTTTAKLARHLQKTGKRPMMVAADVYRPAAIDQLKVLGKRLDIPVFFAPGKTPPQICKDSLEAAQFKGCDVVLFDTAGRTILDNVLMNELEEIKAITRPENILLVLDAMIGQESVNVAREFDRRLDLSGFILTKLDGDARGGAALSIKEMVKKPIKFIGMGESLDRLEEFRPDGLASRILGYGDIVGLVKDFEEVVDEKKAQEDAEKLLRGDFTYNDFLKQLKIMKRMGSLTDLISKLPLGQLGVPQGFQVDDRELVRVEAVINSMTTYEREHPDCLNESRVARISRGCGQPRGKVVELMGRFNTMRGLMRNIGSGKKKALGRLGLNPELAGMLDEQMPNRQKKVLVDLKKKKNMRKAVKKAKRRNR